MKKFLGMEKAGKKSLYRNLFCRAIILVAIIFSATSAFAANVTPQGQKLSHFLDNMDVLDKWQPGSYVEWRSGRSVGEAENDYPTHCSAFVAATAYKLGVYILRPPQHDQGLLANAQYYWLKHNGKRYGWYQIKSPLVAQKIANQGCLTVAAYANPNPERHGHIAIVRPSGKSKFNVLHDGPQIIQAGSQNYNSTSQVMGFGRHPAAISGHAIKYYAHKTPFCKILGKEKDKDIA